MSICLGRLKLATLLSLLVLALAAAMLPGETTAQVRRTGMLEGRVIDKASGVPIPGANVILAGTSYGAATDTTGRYLVRNLPPGDYTIGVSVIGYKRAQANIVVSVWQTGTQDFALEVEPIPMEQVETEAPRAELAKDIQISVQELRGAELQLAGSAAQADLFRTIQTLPSVAQTSDFSSELYIRGGSPDQNLVLLDGATIYNPFHFSGFFGAFNSLGVESAELFAGGYPARYGGRVSSVLDIKNKVGNAKSHHGQFNVDFLSSNGLIEGPIPGGSFCFSGRHSFKRYLNILNRSGIYGADVPPYQFYDFQGKIVTHLSPSNTLILSGYWADDSMKGYEEKRDPLVAQNWDIFHYLQATFSLNYDAAMDLDKFMKQMFGIYQSRFSLDVDWGNRAGSCTWQYFPSERFSSSISYSASRFFSYLNETDNTMFPSSFRFNEIISDNTVNGDAIWFPADWIQVRSGFQSKDVGVNYLLTSPQEKLQPQLFPIEPDFTQIQAQRSTREISTYAETSIDITQNLLLNSGIRLSHYKIYTNKLSDKYSFNFLNYSHEIRYFEPVSRLNFEPRIGLRYNLNEDNILKLSYGIYHQDLMSIPLRSGSNMTVLNLWLPLDGKYRSIRANHYILGYKRYLPEGYSVSMEIYYKYLSHFLERSDSYLSDDPYGFFQETPARVKGFELLVRRQGRNTYGWLGYSFSQATVKSNGMVYDLWYDQRHRINFVLHWFSYDRKWETTWAWTYSTGLPYTKIISDCLTLDLRGENDPAGIVGFDFLPVNMNGRKNAWRFPAYHRMDLSIKRLILQKPFTMYVNLWWVNLYNRQNVLFYRYQGAYTQQSKISMLPSTPFLGVEAKF